VFVYRENHSPSVRGQNAEEFLCQAGGIYSQLSPWFKEPDMSKEYVLHKRY